jgi:hypothetical protein
MLYKHGTSAIKVPDRFRKEKADSLVGRDCGGAQHFAGIVQLRYRDGQAQARY